MNEIGRGAKGSEVHSGVTDLWKPGIGVVEREGFESTPSHGSVYHDVLEFRHLPTFIDDRRSVLMKGHTPAKPSDILTQE